MIQNIAILLLFVFLIIESIQALLSRNNGKPRELLSTVFIVLSSTIWIFSAIDFYLISFTICKFPSFVTWIGNALFASGIVIRTIAFIQLGQFYHYNLNIKNSHRLIMTGIYSRVRHPLYLGTLLVFFGFPLAVQSAGGIALFFLLAVPAVWYRIRVEEKMLSSHFGKEWNEYVSTTSTLWPF
ncbi:isoprenylcysteine carboxylmethyltransferase family protein [Myxococcota bacterium]|nr:isoprenylcysteine carboxylmethyltransferase family protein [Myxococcota bacterium]MBU1380818.1 isoprenylcysteine carboxylmethyltransferase family protein [Myxococcota bacterium]MBU1498952.1 isoprenylcysteine carboxylmethyltransferase family protein [Myxococcota bacterium]